MNGSFLGPYTHHACARKLWWRATANSIARANVACARCPWCPSSRARRALQKFPTLRHDLSLVVHTLTVQSSYDLSQPVRVLIVADLFGLLKFRCAPGTRLCGDGRSVPRQIAHVFVVPHRLQMRRACGVGSKSSALGMRMMLENCAGGVSLDLLHTQKRAGRGAHRG